MAKIQMSLFNRSDAAALSGGSWLGGSPLTNLQQTLLSRVARSADVLATSTRIDIDYTVSTTIVRLVALARHNCTLDATYRITAGTTSGASNVYDSGTLAVWPAIYDSLDLEWEDDNFWTGQATTADIDGYPISLVHDCLANVQARYWRIQITDTANPAGYIDLARLWMGPIWQPTRNFSYGAQLAWESRSVSEYSLGGVLYNEPRTPARVYRFALSRLTDAEAYGQILDMQRRIGTAGELWVVPNADDTSRRFKRDFLARIRKFDPITQGLARMQETSFEMEERL
jgi:hypothetical protein